MRRDEMGEAFAEPHVYGIKEFYFLGDFMV